MGVFCVEGGVAKGGEEGRGKTGRIYCRYATERGPPFFIFYFFGVLGVLLDVFLMFFFWFSKKKNGTLLTQYFGHA